MRNIGVTARGIRLPILAKGDNLVDITVEYVMRAAESEGYSVEDNDIIAITEAVVAKTQGNYVMTSDIAADVRQKFGGGQVGVVYPILSRNRFEGVLRGIAKGAEMVWVLLNYPQDEVGNPIVDLQKFDSYTVDNRLYSSKEFKQTFGDYKHKFTGINYMDMYEGIADNIKVYVSRDPQNILGLTKNIIAADIHSRHETKNYLLKKGAEKVCTLADILTKPIGESGYNADYGVLGSNTATSDTLKLFPRDCKAYVNAIRNKIKNLTGKVVEVLIYGDGAFKDPACGIWELADPVVSPAYTEKLANSPNEVKLKRVADEKFAALSVEERTSAMKAYLCDQANKGTYDGGTTPRKIADLVGSLSDLMSGSGDKGTPVIHIKGYFDDYSKG